MKRPSSSPRFARRLAARTKRRACFAMCGRDDLAVAVVKALVERSGIDPTEIEDVVLGNTQQQGEQGLNVARTVALMAGLPMHSGGATINRLCGSSLQALNQAAHSIIAGGGRCANRRRPGAHAAHSDGCRHRFESQAVRAHEQRRADDGRDGRVSGPDAGHFARGSRRVRPAQPSTRRRGDGQRRIQAGDRAGLRPRRSRQSHSGRNRSMHSARQHAWKRWPR